jgi:hypothetical protein
MLRRDLEAGGQGVGGPTGDHPGHVEQHPPGEQEVPREGLDPEVAPDPVGPARRLDRIHATVELQVPADVAEGVDRRRSVLAGEVEDLRRPGDLAARGRAEDLVGLAVSGVEGERVRRVERQDRGRLVPREPEIEHAGGADAADEGFHVHLLRRLRRGLRRERHGGRGGDPAEESPARELARGVIARDLKRTGEVWGGR